MLVAFFYSNYGLLVSHLQAYLQAVLDVLTLLFNRVDLPTNVNKVVGIVFQKYHMAGGHPESAYEIQMTGVGTFYRGGKHKQVRFPECVVDLATGALAEHCQTQHGIYRWGHW